MNSRAGRRVARSCILLTLIISFLLENVWFIGESGSHVHVASPPKSQFRGPGMNTAILLHCLRDASLEKTSGPSFESMHNSNYANLHTHRPKYSNSNDTFPQMIIKIAHFVLVWKSSECLQISEFFIWFTDCTHFDCFHTRAKVHNLNDHSNWAIWIIIRITAFWTVFTQNYIAMRDLNCAIQMTVWIIIWIAQIKLRIVVTFCVHMVQNTVIWMIKFKLCNLNDHSNCTLLLSCENSLSDLAKRQECSTWCRLVKVVINKL